MSALHVEPVVTYLQVPPGMLGPDPATIEVRCFIVVGSGGVILVDTGPPGTGEAIGSAIARAGATWSDVTDIVLTHQHFDHVGGLAESAELASRAAVWAGADDVGAIPFDGRNALRPLAEGDLVGDLRILHTPGHTPGHLSLLHEAAALLLIGDVVGSSDGGLDFGPAAFTADSARNRQSLRRMMDLQPERILFSHGEEVPNAGTAIRQLLDRS